MKSNKIFIVNLDNELLQYLPNDIKNCELELINQKHEKLDENWQNNYNQSKKLLKKYQEAKLIITTALHCASPCLALGIPVVLIADDYEEQCNRFSAIDSLIKVYSINDLKENKINFYPKTLDLSYYKSLLEKNLELSIQKALVNDFDKEDELQEVRKNIYDFKLWDER